MPVAGERGYKCRNVPGRPSDKYEYGVKLTGVPRLDPWVVNH
jgi:hypothetical protein